MVNQLVVENLKHRPIRTLLTVLAIGLQVTLVLTIVGLSRGMLDASAKRTRGVGADIMVRPPGSSILTINPTPMSEGLVAFVEKYPHVTLVTATVVHGVGGLDSITGIDIEKFDKMSGGFRYLSGGPFKTQDDILVDEFFAKQRKLKEGDFINLANHNWTVRGVVESGKLARTFVPLKRLQELTSSTGRVSFIYAKLDDPNRASEVIASIKEKLPDYPIYSMEEFLSLITIDRVPGLSPFIAVIIALAIIFGFLVVFLAMYTAVLERTREIGILKALGATPAFVMGMLLKETLLLALIGSVTGVLLAFVARWAILTSVPASLPVAVVPDWWWRAALISVTGAVLGALYPGLRAARQDAIEALAYE